MQQSGEDRYASIKGNEVSPRELYTTDQIIQP